MQSLYEIVAKGDARSLQHQLETGGVWDLSWRNPNDGLKTCLHVAAAEGKHDMVMLLIDYGAPLSIYDGNGLTPLEHALAVDTSNRKCIKLLAQRLIIRAEGIISPLKQMREGSREPDWRNMTLAEKRAVMLKKVTCVNRDSLLDEMFQLSHFRTLYNIFIAVMVLLFIEIIIHNFQERGRFTDFSLLIWVFGRPKVFLFTWGCLAVSQGVTYVLVRVCHNAAPRRMERLLPVHFVSMIIQLLFAGCMVHYNHFPPATAMSILMEATRMVMKMHSYFWTQRDLSTLERYQPTADKQQQNNHANNGASAPSAASHDLSEKSQEDANAMEGVEKPPTGARQVKGRQSTSQVARRHGGGTRAPTTAPAQNHHHSSAAGERMVRVFPSVSFRHFMYFLFAPTLIYQTSYPMRPCRSIRKVLLHFAETAATILYMYCIFERFCAPFLAADQLNMTLIDLAIQTFKMMVPATGVFLFAFYGVLHCWMNAWAEMLRFGDRQFYSDWWTCTDWGSYYRRWNILVHNWIYRFLFLECYTQCGWSHQASMAACFIISAVIHEYIIMFSIHFLRPIMFFMFLVPGTFFISLTRAYKGHRFWNIFMWLMLMVGNGFLMSLYTRAWHLKVHNVDAPLIPLPSIQYPKIRVAWTWYVPPVSSTSPPRVPHVSG